MVHFITSHSLYINWANCHANRLSLDAVTRLIPKNWDTNQWHAIESCFIQAVVACVGYKGSGAVMGQ